MRRSPRKNLQKRRRQNPQTVLRMLQSIFDWCFIKCICDLWWSIENMFGVNAKRVVVPGFRFFEVDSRYFQSLFALWWQSLKKRRCVVDRVTTAVVAFYRWLWSMSVYIGDILWQIWLVTIPETLLLQVNNLFWFVWNVAISILRTVSLLQPCGLSVLLDALNPLAIC